MHKMNRLAVLLALGGINMMTLPADGVAPDATPGADLIPGQEIGGVGGAAPAAPEAAGVVNPIEEVSLPDTTEGNRGPSSTTRNNGDPTAVITTPVPEVVDPGNMDGTPTIGNSTNAVTAHAQKTLSPMMEVTLQLTRQIEKTYDVKPAFVEALGTDNVQPGPFNSAFRSINFKYPEAHGQRACILYKDGRIKFLASGTTYADWYAMSRAEDVAVPAIVYFNQSPAADNPFVSVRWYKKEELPEAMNIGDDSL